MRIEGFDVIYTFESSGLELRTSDSGLRVQDSGFDVGSRVLDKHSWFSSVSLRV
jgi:hypothetical protein